MPRLFLVALMLFIGATQIWLVRPPAVSSSSAQAGRQAESFPYNSYDLREGGGGISLSLSAMTSLPNGVVFVGGSVRTLAGPIHKCMLISRDGARSGMTLN